MRKFFAIALVSSLALSACDRGESSDTAVSRKVEQAQTELEAQVGQPAVPNGTSKRTLKLFYEAEDDPNLQSYTYTQDKDGRFHLFCESFSLPIPYSTQYTNSEKYSYVRGTFPNGSRQTEGTFVLLPQAEPDGLFHSPSSEATRVMCKNPKTGKGSPTYSELRLTTFLYPREDAVK
ncbi:MAG: hypothetical protein ACKVOE_05730 [Rickettsiales bacterium]